MSTLRYIPDHEQEGYRCPWCAGHGVLSKQVGTEVEPGVYEYEQRDMPCSHHSHTVDRGGQSPRAVMASWQT